MARSLLRRDKKKVEIQNPQKITMKNGKPATKGTCPECGNSVFRIGAADRSAIPEGGEGSRRNPGPLLIVQSSAKLTARPGTRTRSRRHAAAHCGRVARRNVSRPDEPSPRPRRRMRWSTAQSTRCGRRATKPMAKGAGEPVALGISAPGPLDPSDRRAVDPPNLDRSCGALVSLRPLETRARRRGLPGARHAGCGRSPRAVRCGTRHGDYVYLTVSTGIGGGVVIDNRLLRGPDGVAGELGHMTLDWMARSVAVARAATSRRSAAERASPAQLAKRGLGDISAVLVAALEDAGDATAQQHHGLRPARICFGRRVDRRRVQPQPVVVGGGIAIGQGDRLLQPAREAVKQLSFRRQAARVEIVAAQLGDDVGLIGALSLVRLARFGEDRDLN